MKKSAKIPLLIVAVLAVLIAIAGFSSYNGLASAREAVDTQQANIQTQLQRRADLIPNLVSSVKGITGHEQAVVDSVTEARAALVGAQSLTEQADANDALSGALSRLLVVVENYPQIQSSPAYTALMDELAGSENRIGAARTDYNAAVRTYNSKIIRFPSNLFAGLLGFQKAPYFEAAEGAADVPSVDFGS